MKCWEVYKQITSSICYGQIYQLPHAQVDQIGRYFKVLGTKFTHKFSQIYRDSKGYFENVTF